MRSIGVAERALELMIRRSTTRHAFGKPIIQLGKNIEWVSRARIEIDACRLMVLQAAKAMDTLGNKEARVYVSAIKAMVPEKVCNIIDQAIQIHGATGVSQWTPLARMYTSQRTLAGVHACQRCPLRYTSRTVDLDGLVDDVADFLGHHGLDGTDVNPGFFVA